jgi:O-acetyl-ADP-ribose deacetylase (regulator of RNase III)
VAADFLQYRGIAVKFHERFGQRELLLSMGKIKGETAALPIGENDYVFYLVTKEFSIDKPLLSNVRKSLWELRQLCEDFRVTELALPRISSGLDKLPWDKVEYEICYVFSGSDISIDIYDTPPEIAQQEEERKERERARRSQQKSRRGASNTSRSPRINKEGGRGQQQQVVRTPVPQHIRSPLKIVDVVIPRPPPVSPEIVVVEQSGGKTPRTPDSMYELALSPTPRTPLVRVPACTPTSGRLPDATAAVAAATAAADADTVFSFAAPVSVVDEINSKHSNKEKYKAKRAKRTIDIVLPDKHFQRRSSRHIKT